MSTTPRLSHRSSDEDDYESELPMTIDNWVIKGPLVLENNCVFFINGIFGRKKVICPYLSDQKATKFSKTASGKSDIRHDLGVGLTPSHSNMHSPTCRIWPCAIVFVNTSRLSQSDDTLGKYIQSDQILNEHILWDNMWCGTRVPSGACLSLSDEYDIPTTHVTVHMRKWLGYRPRHVIRLNIWASTCV